MTDAQLEAYVNIFYSIITHIIQFFFPLNICLSELSKTKAGTLVKDALARETAAARVRGGAAAGPTVVGDADKELVKTSTVLGKGII